MGKCSLFITTGGGVDTGLFWPSEERRGPELRVLDRRKIVADETETPPPPLSPTLPTTKEYFFWRERVTHAAIAAVLVRHRWVGENGRRCGWKAQPVGSRGRRTCAPPGERSAIGSVRRAHGYARLGELIFPPGRGCFSTIRAGTTQPYSRTGTRGRGRRTR